VFHIAQSPIAAHALPPIPFVQLLSLGAHVALLAATVVLGACIAVGLMRWAGLGCTWWLLGLLPALPVWALGITVDSDSAAA
jgi:hypothetical protein